MTQRRSPSGQGPSGRPRQSTGRRGGPARVGGGRAAAARVTPASERPTVVFRPESGRSAKRPATARRAATPGAATRTAPPKTGGLSGRAWALALVLLALVLAYGYPLRLYLNQEAEIQRIQTSQAAQRAEIKALSDESAKYHDKAYLMALARARFQMVTPGVKGYIVLPDPVAPTPAASCKPAEQTWYSKLWGSIRGDGQ